jgi:hypothetical protein
MIAVAIQTLPDDFGFSTSPLDAHVGTTKPHLGER